MKKRVWSLLLALALLAGISGLLQPRALAAHIFRDVGRDKWYAGSVYALAEAGIVNGMTRNTFAPNATVTRAELVKLMAAAAASADELEEYRADTRFTDVSAKAWYAPYVHWGAAHGVAKGYPGGTFRPNAPVTRAEAAAFVVRFAACVDAVQLEATTDDTRFTDHAALPGWARSDIYTCRRAGVFQGDPDGRFRPNDNMTRAEAAAVLCRLLGITPTPREQLPDYAEPEVFTTTAAGFEVRGVEFDPARGFDGRIVLANDRLFSTERVDSILKRTDAYVAVNGGFFNLSADLTTYATIIADGVPLRIENWLAPEVPAFVIDGGGHASIEHMKVLQTVTLTRDGQMLGAAEECACNFPPSATNADHIVYTPEFGASVAADFDRAVAVDADGVVTAVYAELTERADIPQEGFLLAERGAEGMLSDCAVGDRLERSVAYEGASTQDIRAALSCGPTIVRDGKAYGDAMTYAREGFHAADIVSLSAVRMAIGVKADGTVVIATVKCTMRELSQVMLALGCEDAMNLDGGSSSALYAGDTAIIQPGRSMNTMIVFTIQ